MKRFSPIKHLKLPFIFDEKALRRDLASMLDKYWVDHYNKQAYEGDWKSISLYSADGKGENIFAVQNLNTELRPTPLVRERNYFIEVIQTFECPLLSVRLLKLSPGARIKPHRDHKLGYENDNFRIHIPIVTNPEVKFIIGGERISMQSGECWYTNVNYTHSVTNEGSVDRIHLVIDCERNRWSDNLFFSLAAKEDLVMVSEDDLQDTYRSIISELERIHEPAAKKLIVEYQEKLKELKDRQHGDSTKESC